MKFIKWLLSFIWNGAMEEMRKNQMVIFDVGALLKPRIMSLRWVLFCMKKRIGS